MIAPALTCRSYLQNPTQNHQDTPRLENRLLSRNFSSCVVVYQVKIPRIETAILPFHSFANLALEKAGGGTVRPKKSRILEDGRSEV